MPAQRNIRLTLAYDGTNYVGWQVQKNGLSIQEVLERAIEKLTGEKCPVLSAGRTDSGVHALGQVANFFTTSVIPARKFRPALQDFLPHDIVILESCDAPPEFHATFKAVRKQYRYLIDNSPVPLPFLSKYTWSLRRRLDVAAMDEAAQLLLGMHDFRSFETDWPNKVTSVRTIFEIRVARRPLWNLFTGSLSELTSPPLSKGGQGGRVTLFPCRTELGETRQAKPATSSASTSSPTASSTTWSAASSGRWSTSAGTNGTKATSPASSKRRTAPLPARPPPPAVSSWSKFGMSDQCVSAPAENMKPQMSLCHRNDSAIYTKITAQIEIRFVIRGGKARYGFIEH